MKNLKIEKIHHLRTFNMKNIKLFEEFTHDNIKNILDHFFTIRKMNKKVNNTSVSFKDVYDEYLSKRKNIEVDEDNELGLDVYNHILKLTKEHINKDTITLYRAMYISDNIDDINYIYNSESYYKGVGEFWTFDINSAFQWDENDDMRNGDIDFSLPIIMEAEVSPNVIDWENTFKHSVSEYGSENEITLSYGSIFLTNCYITNGDFNIKVKKDKYIINEYVSI